LHAAADVVEDMNGTDRIVTRQDKTRQDKRLFHCGSQETGLVKYDKYTWKK